MRRPPGPPLPPLDPDQPQTEHAAPATGRRLVTARTALAAGAAGLVVGAIMGGAGAAGSEPTPAPTPVVRTERVEVPVEVPTVPRSCLDALVASDAAFDLTGKAFGITSEMFTLSSSALTALSEGRFADAEAANAQMVTGRDDLDAIALALQPRVEDYRVARDECRDAS